MQDELSSLIKLQELDNQADEVRDRAAELLPQIQEKNRKIDQLKDALKTAKEQLSSHTIKKKQLEMDADAKEKQVQKFNGELNSLKSNDQYKAMLSEIQAAKNAIVKIEDDILALMEAVEADDKRFKEKEKQFKDNEGAVKREIQALEAQKAALEAEEKTKRDERNAYAKSLKPGLLEQYEAIREKRGGVAIVSLENNTCGGCRMTLPPNKINDVKKAKNMVLCDSCMRILYAPAAPAAADSATPA